MSAKDALSSAIAELPGPILVLGASGFVGANLMRRLLDVRDDVAGTGLTWSTWRTDGIPADRLHDLDLLEPGHVRALLDRLRPAAIFDCTAYGAYSFQTDIDLIYRTNFLACAGLLEDLAQRSIKAYVHSGSSSEYGLNADKPDETVSLIPNSPYAVSKAAAGHLIAYYGKVRGVPCVNLRLYSVYGPYEDSSRLIPTLVERGLRGELPPFVAPDTVRDFVHVDDVCEAFVLAALRMSPEMHGESFNIGSGRETTIREVAELARETFGIEAKPAFGAMEQRAWDTADWSANAGKAARVLEWSARTTLAEGFRRTVDWWSEFLKERSFAELTHQAATLGSKRGVSAVIACYMDGQAIPIMYERLVAVFSKLGIDYEIIFVNDGSPDDSAERIREISEHDSRVIGITHSRNFGSQAAFRSGMELASKDACVLLDGDLQDPPELIEQFVETWRDGAEIVYGRRVKREMSALQGALYKGFYRLLNALSYIPIPRDAGDFSLIDRRAVRWMLEFQERDSFLRGLRAYVGFRQVGVEYERPERMFGRSTNSLLKNIGWAKKGIFSFSRVPLNLLTFCGTALFLVSVLLAAVTLGLKLFVPDIAPRGVTTLLLVVLFFGSVNLLAVAVIGEYIGKIIEEVKRRPPFIRSSLISGGEIVDMPPES